MPVTRRKRATPPEENTNQVTEVTTQAGEHTAAQEPVTSHDMSGTNSANGTASISEQPSSLPSASAESAPRPKERTHTRRVRREEPSQSSPTSPASQQDTRIETPAQLVEPMQPVQSVQPVQQQPFYTSRNTTPPAELQSFVPPVSQASQGASSSPSSPSSPFASERERTERGDYTPTIEPGRRTARGELFRRPPQIPTPHSGPNHQSAPSAPSAPSSVVSSAPVQSNQPHTHAVHVPQASPTPPTPTHEISLPLGNLLHLAYNPGYTGSEEARSTLLHKLASESKAGGRARCWNCGSLAVVYDRWNTRSKTFGEVGVAICEVCGAWSVL